ncbi:hypothetical protein OZX73_05395 [Bifidobacterium sp. ESL0775]|uniref:hypothetical protein n=1 Tax=Bifidobacterium sp. ESL0775 TaxID=2983230 RepID=UPI0023F9E97F|nr:hypothetical protein [Bifidobacterium sp. ESL0775]WEV68727.1 hypothetical protein OZX73_05395 [Bifidobacterium sp. ESL0775]
MKNNQKPATKAGMSSAILGIIAIVLFLIAYLTSSAFRALLALGIVVAVAGIVTGIIGTIAARTKGSRSGQQIAVIGLILSCIPFIVMFVFTITQA